MSQREVPLYCERFMIVRLRFRGRLFRELLVCCFSTTELLRLLA